MDGAVRRGRGGDTDVMTAVVRSPEMRSSCCGRTEGHSTVSVLESLLSSLLVLVAQVWRWLPALYLSVYLSNRASSTSDRGLCWFVLPERAQCKF